MLREYHSKQNVTNSVGGDASVPAQQQSGDSVVDVNAIVDIFQLSMDIACKWIIERKVLLSGVYIVSMQHISQRFTISHFVSRAGEINKSKTAAQTAARFA